MDRARFAARPAVQAIRRLEQVGYSSRATALYNQLSQELDSVGELALLAVMAERNENHYLALRVGKMLRCGALMSALYRIRSAQFPPPPI